jgi:hypothetical protein
MARSNTIASLRSRIHRSRPLLSSRYLLAITRRTIHSGPYAVELLSTCLAQLYMRMAEGIREGKSASPDFDVAVNRHQLLDALQKASDTGIHQIL